VGRSLSSGKGVHRTSDHDGGAVDEGASFLLAGLNSHDLQERGPLVAPYALLPLVPGAYASTRTRMDDMLAHLQSAAMDSVTAEELEVYVTEAGREIQRQAIQDYLDVRAAGEVRVADVVGADGIARSRAERGHRRQLATSVGRVEVARIAYRAPKAPNVHLADEELQLPAQLYSRVLQRQIVQRAAATSLRATAASVLDATGCSLGTRQIMEVCERAAADIRGFYALAPQAAVSSDLLVLSCDATGINMIDSGLREAVRQAAQAEAVVGPRPPSAQLHDRTRTGRRRMATVTAVYDASAVARTAADVMPSNAAERAGRNREAPRASGREVHACVMTTTAEMISSMFDLAEQRDPHHRRRWIALVDGNNHQIERIEHEAMRRGVHVDIVIDFVHVLEYLWKAAEDIHPGYPARQGFVAAGARAILEGKVRRVITELRHVAETEKARGTKASGIERAAAYLSAKTDNLAYDIALALGWPIATGVIEGCCRYLVKDRLDVTGARWSLPGAEAILLLRTVIDNGDFEAYWVYHGQREHERQHTARYRCEYAPAA
jgi:hypothetical protein